MVARVRAEALTRAADKRLNDVLVAAPRVHGWTRSLDARLNRLLVDAWPKLATAGRRLKTAAAPWLRRLQPLAVFLLRVIGWLERRLLRLRDLAVAVATRASAVLTPHRAICAVIVAAAACLAVSQFVDYRAVEIGQPGYSGLPGDATPPTTAAETPTDAHSYLLLAVALLAAALALAALRNERRRGLGRIILGLGLLSLALILLVDLPAGQDAGSQAVQFAGASAVLYDGFYAEIAAAAGLMLGGILLVLAPKAAARYHARPCRTRTNSFARAVSALRRRRPRRASSRGRATRRRSRRRKGAVSAPASPR